MPVANKLSIVTHFKNVNDPRIERRKKHLLLEIIGLTICAVVADGEGWEHGNHVLAVPDYSWGTCPSQR